MNLATGSLAAEVQAVVSPERAARFFLPELDTLRFFAFFGVFLFHLIPVERGAIVRAIIGQPIGTLLMTFVSQASMA
jgi:peptidoglycan/LPS O-acetylase OafA/YrhL